MRRRSLKKPPLSAALLSTLLITVLMGCAAKGPDTHAVEPWYTYLHDDGRTNFTEETVSFPLKGTWTEVMRGFKLINLFPDEELSGPVIDNGALFIGSTAGRLYSFDLYTGDLLWRFKAGEPIEAPATVAGDRVCFGTGEGVLRCLDRDTGRELWSYQVRSEIISSPVITDDSVYFSSSDDRVYALDLQTGEKIWTYTHGTFQTVVPRLYVSPAVKGNKVYHYFSDGVVAAISTETGREVWTRKLSENLLEAPQARRTPLVADERVYVIDSKGTILVLDSGSGETLNEYDIIKARDFLVLPGRLMIIAGENQIVAIDRLSGSLLWKREAEYGRVSTILATADHLVLFSNLTTAWIKIISTSKGYIQALDLSSGDLIWTKKLGSTISSNASASGRRVALFTDEGELKVFGPK